MKSLLVAVSDRAIADKMQGVFGSSAVRKRISDCTFVISIDDEEYLESIFDQKVQSLKTLDSDLFIVPITWPAVIHSDVETESVIHQDLLNYLDFLE